MVNIKECSTMDIETLAQLNKMLIEDEKANNKMDLEQLKDRMEGFLNGGYKAYYFLENDGKILGYALCDFNKTPIYLRQFFIKRDERRKKYGKESFKKLTEHIKTDEIEIDVYVWNDVGIKFWESLGFESKYIHMAHNPECPPGGSPEALADFAAQARELRKRKASPVVSIRVKPEALEKYKALGRGYSGIMADVLNYVADNPEILSKIH
jgi:N-acetylglutamate synthase-like GNAT family acetyltransferase/uncharacterized protein (DUF4415 family)